MAKTKAKQLVVMVKEFNDLFSDMLERSYQRMFVCYPMQCIVTVCEKGEYCTPLPAKTTDITVITNTIQALKQIYNKENIYIAHHPYFYDNDIFFLAIYVFIY